MKIEKTYDHQTQQARTSRGIDSDETNQAGAGDAIMSGPRDKLKTLYLHYQSAFGYPTRLCEELDLVYLYYPTACGCQTCQSGDLL